MNTNNRDLLVLLNQDLMSPQAIEHQVEQIHEMLYRIETTENLCIVHEILDLNRYRVISKPTLIRDFIRKKEDKAFIFLNNKN